MKKTKKMQLIYIEWLDACSINHWQSFDETLEWAKDDNDPYIKQTGWIVFEDKKILVIAARQGRNIFNGEEKHEQSYGLVQKIPKTWIRKRINLTRYIK